MHARGFLLVVIATVLTALLHTYVDAAPQARGGQRAAPVGDDTVIQQLVLVNRMLSSREMSVLGAYGHVSLRSRTHPNHYFIARAVAPGLVSARDIYESDLDSNPVGADRTNLLPERFMHSEIYRAKPEVMAIVYTRAPSIVAFSISSIALPRTIDSPDRDKNLLRVFDTRRLPGGDQGLINTPALGKALADAFGPKTDAMLILGSGAVIASTSTTNVVNGALDLRTGADIRIFEIQVGGPLSHRVFTRDKAIPEAGSVADTGPSGQVERINRFAASFNHLAIRDMARAAPAPPSPAPTTDQALIQELTMANRLLASAELGVLTPDGLAHISVRSRSNPDHFFIAGDVSPAMVTTNDIIEDDRNAVPVKPEQRTLAQYSERYIHAEIYKARPDVMAVLHAHTPELVVFGQSQSGLQPVLNAALFMGEGLPVYDITKFTGGAPSPVSCSWCISTPQLGRALAQVMGKNDGSLLLDHGIALTGPSLRALVSRAYNLRMNAKIQAQAQALGGKVNTFNTAAKPSDAGAVYPEWDYWKQAVFGALNAVDPNVAYAPAGGLPIRRE